jgi:hypothetical protein
MAKEGYKLLSKSYEGNKKKLKYICPNGHRGEISYNNWVSGIRCFECKYERFTGEGNPRWLGGITERNLTSYKTFSKSLANVETVRRDPSEPDILQAKCNYCGKWFRPSRSAVKGRLQALMTSDASEVRLYCSEECKRECPIFRKRLFPSGFKQASSREVQAELRQMVFERDAWECVRCGATSPLNCHHVTGIKQNPLESADMDNCVTLCKKCHKWAHTKAGCRYFELRCKKTK